MTSFLQFTVAGLAQGSVYALLAVGLIAVFSVRHIVNLTQGEFATFAALGSIWLINFGMPPLVAILIGVVSVTLIAVLMERLVIARVKNMTTLVSIILTLGLATAMQAFMLVVWGADAKKLPEFPPAESLFIFGVSIQTQQIWMLGALIVVGGGIMFFYDKTKFGKAMRAVAEQPVAARIVGISPAMASITAFAIAGFSGSVAGVVASPLYFTIWSGGLLLALKGFVAAVLGGLSSFSMAIVGGLLLGLVEAYVSAYISSGYRDAAAFLILILVLIIRPSGLLRKTNHVRV